jgi:predicted Fe-S protein YdhL (DUF1289 family)
VSTAPGPAQAPPPVSPCVAVCVLDQRYGFCRGCGRNIAEIAAWSGLDAEAKHRILAVLPGRLGAMAGPPISR